MNMFPFQLSGVKIDPILTDSLVSSLNNAKEVLYHQAAIEAERVRAHLTAAREVEVHSIPAVAVHAFEVEDKKGKKPSALVLALLGRVG